MLAITIVLFVVPHNQQFVKILQFFSHIVFPCSETKILIYKKKEPYWIPLKVLQLLS